MKTNIAPKERPYIRRTKRLGLDREKPRFRIVAIDPAGRRKQITVSMVSSDPLPEIEREFLRALAASEPSECSDSSPSSLPLPFLPGLSPACSIGSSHHGNPDQ
jgi:hypothetical protein